MQNASQVSCASRINRWRQTGSGISFPYWRSTPLLKSLSVAVAFAAVALANPPSAHAVGFSLGDFETYGLLVNNGASGGDINTPPVNANIGIGNTTGPINLHNEVVNGKVDCSSSCSSAVSGGTITGTQPVSRGGALPSGSPASVNSNVAAVGSAISDALTLSSFYGAESGTGVTLGGNVTIDASSGLLDGTGTRIFTATNALTIGNGHTLTINGSASDYVVLNVAAASGNKLDGALSLTGGITPDQVLINFTGTGGANIQGAANGASLYGTFLAADLGIQLNSLTIVGHLFGGAAGHNFQFVSNAFISQPTVPTVPLPSSVFLLGTAVAGLGWLASCCRRKQPVA